MHPVFSAKAPTSHFEIGGTGYLGKNLALQIGFSKVKQHYLYTSWEKTKTKKTLSTFAFPVKLKLDLCKFAFDNAGFLLNASGGGYYVDLGVGAGAGIQYFYKDKFGEFIARQTNIHSLTVVLSKKHFDFGLACKIKNQT